MGRYAVMLVAGLVLMGVLVWHVGAPGTDEGDAGSGEREASDTRAPDLKGPRLEGAGGNERTERPAPVVAARWTAPVVRGEAGGIVLRGRVIDVEGRAVPGGEVHALVFGPGTALVTRPEEDGTFELRTTDARAGSWALRYRKGEDLSSALLHLAPMAGTVTEGLELVALPPRRVSVTVRHPDGAPAPMAVVEVQAGVPDFRVPLDGNGQAEFGFPPDQSGRISAQTPDGRHRVAAPVGPVATSIDLVLRGPWEPLQIYCRSSPEGAFGRRTARIYAGWSQGPQTTCAVEVDGPAGSLFAPPAFGQSVYFYASVGSDGSGGLEIVWSEAEAATHLRNGLSLTVTRRVDVVLRIVDKSGAPIPAFYVVTPDQNGWTTDGEGRVRLEGRTSVPDMVQTVAGDLSVGPPEPETGERVVTVPVVSRIGGRFTGPATLRGISLEPMVWVGAGHVIRGRVDRGRWVASVPFPAGKPAKVQVIGLMEAYTDMVQSRLGAEDVDFVVHASSLAVEPHHGRVVRPRGTIRLRRLNDSGEPEGSWTAEVTPASPVPTFAPLQPGRYEVSLSIGPVGPWIVHPAPIEVGEEHVHVVLDFPPP
jgi:hypothetical protein